MGRRLIVILLSVILCSCSQRFYNLNGSTKYIYSDNDISIQVELDVYLLEKEQSSLRWNNLIRFKITNKPEDSNIIIGIVNCKMVGKKTEIKGIINNADLPLYVHGKKAVEFVIPVTFEYNKSIGANHQVMIDMYDLLINGERIDIRPIVFTYAKIK